MNTKQQLMDQARAHKAQGLPFQTLVDRARRANFQLVRSKQLNATASAMRALEDAERLGTRHHACGLRV